MLHTRATLAAAKDAAKDPLLHGAEDSPWAAGTVAAFCRSASAATGAVWTFQR